MNYSISREITLNGRKVKYILEYKNIKNINIRITPEKGFRVSAPLNVEISLIEKFLKEKSKQILDALDKCKQINSGTPPKNPTKPTSGRRTINLKGKTVEYELEFKDVKRINLSIKLQKGIRVSAPKKAGVAAVEKFMRENADFILSTLEKYQTIEKELPKPKKYENGEYIYFLGEKITLRLFPSQQNYAEICGTELHLYTENVDNFYLKEQIIDTFIKNECKKYVVKLCNDLYPRFRKKGIAFPKEIRFRKMVSCWGNCRPERGILTFNSLLIQLPPKCIETIVCHEFTHFLHANHSKEFYRQLTEFMPDWKIYDNRIKELQKEIIFRKV